MEERREKFKDEDGIFSEGTTLADISKKVDIGDRPISLLAKVVMTTWHKNVIGTVKEEVAAPLDNFDMDRDGNRVLPGEMVEIDGDLVFVHGINHSFIGRGTGHRSAELVGIVKNYVDKTFADGHEWVVEQGIEKDFGVEDKMTPLADLDVFYADKVRGLNLEEVKNQSLWRKLKAVKQLVQNEITGIVDLLDTVTYAEQPEISGLVSDTRDKMGEDPRYFLKGQQLHDTAMMPQPLDMEIGMVMASKGDLDKPNLLIDRSYQQARLVRERLKELHSKQEEHGSITLHILCGELHRSQDVFFLQNPDYDIRESIRSAKLPIG